MILVVVLVIIVLLWFMWEWSIVRKVQEFWARVKFSRTLPGPGLFSIIGNASEERTLNWINELWQQYGSIFRVWFGEELNVLVSDPDYLKIILTSNTLLVKSPLYDVLDPWLGKGLLTNGGSSWQQKRKLLTPAFHFNILGSFRSPIDDCCSILADKLDTVADGKQVVDIYPYISMLSLDIICETAMGVKSNAQQNSDSEFVRATKTVCQIMIEQMFSLWQRIPILFYFSANGRKRRAALKVLQDQTKRVIKIRRNELAEMNKAYTNIEADDFGTKRRYAFLDCLLKAQMEGAALTDKNIEDEVNTFMFEGHDTTSASLSFAIYALSQNADFQRRAREEILATDDLDSTPYLDAFIKEALRMYPAVPYYGRCVTEPFQLGEHIIPKGTSITVLAYMVHRDPKLYPDPNTFNPDRFLNAELTHPFGHVAFSAGPRNCIGQRFALLEMKCAISRMLRSFDILPVDGSQLQMTARLVLGSINGVPVRLKKRL